MTRPIRIRLNTHRQCIASARGVVYNARGYDLWIVITMGTIYAFANQKGGVGKTTTAVNLGAFLAGRGQRVLLVDLDPQGNASASVGVDRFAQPASVYDLFLGGLSLAELLTPTATEGLTLVPSAPLLAGAEVELANLPGREYILRDSLSALEASESVERAAVGMATDAPPTFDYIFVDCPPSLGVLTVNALAAADHVVVPVQCEYLALEGLALLMQTIALVRENLNPRLTLSGLVMTMYDPRARLAAQVMAEVRRHFPNEVFETFIPRNIRVAEAPSFGEPLVKFDPHSRGAEAYRNLTDEFMRRHEALHRARSSSEFQPWKHEGAGSLAAGSRPDSQGPGEGDLNPEPGGAAAEQIGVTAPAYAQPGFAQSDPEQSPDAGTVNVPAQDQAEREASFDPEDMPAVPSFSGELPGSAFTRESAPDSSQTETL